VVEIVPPEGEYFDYNNKYNGLTTEICPARIADELTAQVQELALKAYDVV
jgi:D-alanine-D-alanine ligase